MPRGGYASKEENFFVYAEHKAEEVMPVWLSKEEKAEIQASRDFWTGVVSEMEQLGLGYSSSVEAISNKMLEFNIAAGTYADANRESLAAAWQPVFDDLYTVMTDGTQFSQLPSFMQDAAIQYYDAYIAGIDQQAALAEGDLMAMAADLTSVVDGMFDHFSQDADFMGLVDQFDELLGGPLTQETVDELNALIPVINEFISAYNGITETTDDDIPLFEEFTLEGLQEAQAEIEATEEAIASLDTADLYRDLAIAREEASRFGSVLSKLGEGEDQFQNIHDAVLATAEEIAAGLGITDTKAIGEIGDALLEGLYSTYPGIADYVDTSTGMLLDGWQEGVANATNPWTELFEQARLEDAMMGTLNVSDDKQVFRFTVPDTDGNWSLYLFSGLMLQTSGNTVTYVKSKLEEGCIPTTWSPAPEDTTSQIEQLLGSIDGLDSTLETRVLALIESMGLSDQFASAEEFLKALEDIELIRSELAQTDSDLTLTFTRLTAAENSLTQMYSYFEMGDDNGTPYLDMGSSSSSVKMRLTNTR